MLQAATQASPVSPGSDYGDEAFEAPLLGHWHHSYMTHITRLLFYSLGVLA